MNSKTVLPALFGAIFLCLVSIFFIYYGISHTQNVLTIIGGALLVLGILRLILFVRTYQKHED